MKYNLKGNSLLQGSDIELDLPEEYFDVTVSKINGYDKPDLTKEQMKKLIDSPVDSKPIYEDAKGCNSAVIIIDDTSRATHHKEIAQIVIDELIEAGVPQNKIWFLMATGAHAPVGRIEFVLKLGEEIVSKYPVYCHNPFANNILIGKTSENIPVEINADAMKADYKIGLGAFVPHHFVGYGGGTKIVLPGISSLHTIEKHHCFVGKVPLGVGLKTTFLKEQNEEAARMAGLNFKIDSVINGNGKACDIIAGDVVTAHRKASSDEKYYNHYSCKIIQDVDIVIANNVFKTTEAEIGLGKIKTTINKGGDLVSFLSAPQGTVNHFYYGFKTFNDLSEEEKTKAKPVNYKNFFILSPYPFPGGFDSKEREGLIFVKSLQEILDIIGQKKRKIAIYPNVAISIFL